MGTPMFEATAQIARYIVEERLGRIPPQAVAVAKQALLDCLGVVLAGSQEACAQIAFGDFRYARNVIRHSNKAMR